MVATNDYMVSFVACSPVYCARSHSEHSRWFSSYFKGTLSHQKYYPVIEKHLEKSWGWVPAFACNLLNLRKIICDESYYDLHLQEILGILFQEILCILFPIILAVASHALCCGYSLMPYHCVSVVVLSDLDVINWLKRQRPAVGSFLAIHKFIWS